MPTCGTSKEKLENKLEPVLVQHERAAKEEGEATAAARRPEPQRRHDQLQRLEKQAARIEACLATHDPKRGQPGQERQSNVTAEESAKRFTAHGVLQGDKSQALVEATPQVIVHAEAFGTGQASGHGPPRLEGAKAHLQAIGWGEDYWAGTSLSADSNSQSEENLKPGAQAQLDASSPDSHFRHRDPRFATQARHPPPRTSSLTSSLRRRIAPMPRNRLATAASEGQHHRALGDGSPSG